MSTEGLPLLSRVADAVYWMARYIERAENVARYIGVNLHLQLDLPLERAHQWQPLIDTTGDTDAFAERYGESTQANVIQFLVYDSKNPNSIISCLSAARENARSVREIISQDMWAQINQMYLSIRALQALPEPSRLLDTFRSIRLACHLFQGITDATMSHNEAWHFLRLGRKLERSDKTSRILDVKYFMLLPSTKDVGTPHDDIHWSAVLKSVSGFEMYRQKYGKLSPRNVVNFLILDREFARSMHFCIRCADESLHTITGTPSTEARYRSEMLMIPLRTELDNVSVDSIIAGGLHEYLDRLQLIMNSVSTSLQDDFVTQGHTNTQSEPKVQRSLEEQTQSAAMPASSPFESVA